MKNITVTVDDELYRRARVRAAEEGTSVSRLVKETLTQFAHQETAAERRSRELASLFAEVDARLSGEAGQPVERGWRQKLYDERFDDTKLGKRLGGHAG